MCIYVKSKSISINVRLMYVYPNEDPLKIDSNQYHQPQKKYPNI